MFKYLKLYKTHEEYEDYLQSPEFTLPNVTHCIKQNDVHYNPLGPIVYETVDLGLPSGTIWIAQNLGARKPENKGLFYQWADTEGYTVDELGSGEGQKYFDWPDYKYCQGTRDSLTKYNSANSKLQLMDDAAYQIDNTMKVPTLAQVNELIALPHVFEAGSGITFTGNNGNTLFIPCAGFLYQGTWRCSDEVIFITNQTSTYFYNTIFAYWGDGSSMDSVSNDQGKCYGFQIRPVLA